MSNAHNTSYVNVKKRVDSQLIDEIGAIVPEQSQSAVGGCLLLLDEMNENNSNQHQGEWTHNIANAPTANMDRCQPPTTLHEPPLPLSAADRPI